MKDLSSIVAKFKVQGTIEEIKPLGAGLINDTYKVNAERKSKVDDNTAKMQSIKWLGV